MTRLFTLLLAASALFTVAPAAPVPAESDKDKVARVWGKVHAPAGAYAVRPDGKLLTLRTIGWPVGFGYSAPPFQVAREVTGDFDVRVKVYSLDMPSRTVHHDDSPQTAAGLHIDGGDCSVSLYRWMAIHKDKGRLQDGMQDCAWVSQRAPGSGSGSYLKEWPAGESLYLRVTRKGEKVAVGISSDGKDWKDRDAAMTGLKLPDAITVGLFLGHTTSQECSATFTEFTVEKLK